MATDGPTPTPCATDIYRNGQHVGMLASGMEGPGACAIEEWVNRLAEASGQRVDWHYSGGRANVLCVGDVALARKKFEELLPKLQERFPDLVWR